MSGLNVSYNKAGHIFSFSIFDQNLKEIIFKENKYNLSAVQSYLDSFLMFESDSKDSSNVYNGDTFAVSQINSNWRVKPLTVLKRENPNNRFLKGLGVEFNKKAKSKYISFDSSLINNPENIAATKIAADSLNDLKNIYVVWDEAKEKWVDLNEAEYPETNEMNEVMFNILKSSMYTDKFKFGSRRVTAGIPTNYYSKIFRELETLTKDLILWKENKDGKKFFKDFRDLENQEKDSALISDLKEYLFINSILSLPEVLPNIAKKYDFENKNAGVMANGNFYDLIVDAKR
jgi:hypothetical protein